MHTHEPCFNFQAPTAIVIALFTAIRGDKQADITLARKVTTYAEAVRHV